MTVNFQALPTKHPDHTSKIKQRYSTLKSRKARLHRDFPIILAGGIRHAIALIEVITPPVELIDEGLSWQAYISRPLCSPSAKIYRYLRVSLSVIPYISFTYC
ncbi:hypothetical protein [Chlorogloeopsis sp. ULAP02]|uniref:hypothetical protein n=1 Tax=Chlorogloeopsis sp. ULAP02 TaxID=3107926 RepID=UPI003134B61E